MELLTTAIALKQTLRDSEWAAKIDPKKIPRHAGRRAGIHLNSSERVNPGCARQIL